MEWTYLTTYRWDLHKFPSLAHSPTKWGGHHVPRRATQVSHLGTEETTGVMVSGSVVARGCSDPWCCERMWLACLNNFAGWEESETSFSGISKNYACAWSSWGREGGSLSTGPCLWEENREGNLQLGHQKSCQPQVSRESMILGMNFRPQLL